MAGRQFFQSTAVYIALKCHHFTQRKPITDPTPIVELGAATVVERYAGIFRAQTQQKPFLFLPHAQRLRVMTYEAIWQPVAEPAPGASKHLHILRVKPDFFMQFARQRLFRTLALVNAALGKLPRVLPAHAPRPEQLALVVGQDDSYIRAKAIGIYHGGDLSIWARHWALQKRSAATVQHNRRANGKSRLLFHKSVSHSNCGS